MVIYQTYKNNYFMKRIRRNKPKIIDSSFITITFIMNILSKSLLIDLMKNVELNKN